MSCSISRTVGAWGSASWYTRPSDSGRPLRYAIALTTKSRGTALKWARRVSPTTGITATFGWRSSHCIAKYGPSYFCVVPVVLSPTTTAGR